MEPLRVETIAPVSLRLTMLRYGAAFQPAVSNATRHVYFSQRLNRWFAVSSLPSGMVKVSHYAQCPCAIRT